jgi:environmental stress-induced protein Ves
MFTVSLELLPAAARTPAPWRNGGGVTSEVAVERSLAVEAEPLPAGGWIRRKVPEFRWRISIADVAADGPFSRFAGYRRIITVLRGAGMELTVDDVPHVIAEPYRPFRFRGSALTDCRLLDGPVVDLNVIAANGEYADIEIIRPSTRVEIAVGATAAVLALDGSIRVRAAEAGAVLVPFDAALVRHERAVTLEPLGPGLVVAVVRLAEPSDG